MNLRNHFALLLVLFGCLTTHTKAQFRITGGQANGTIDITESPYVVRIYYVGKFYCTGALISMQMVATLAQCVKKPNLGDMFVEAGVTNTRQTGQIRTVVRTYYPCAYNSKTNNLNIGAIKLRLPLKPTTEVQMIQLCTSKLTAGTPMRVSGWVSSKRDIGKINNQLVTHFVPIVPRKECGQRFKGTRTVTTSMICAEDRDNGACVGDLGVPGVVEGKLCAFAISGATGGNFPKLYTDVSNEYVKGFLRKKLALIGGN